MYLNQLLTPSKNNIDILRLVAALLVIYGHAPAFVQNAGGGDFVAYMLGFDYSGSLAVKFFFMLSGLLVTNSLMSRPHLIEFLVKRSARIFPGLIVCVFVTTFIVGPFFTTLGLFDYLVHPQAWKYFIHNSLISNIQWFLPGVFTESSHGINGSLWTLPLEFQCYLFLGAFFAIGIWRNTWLATIFLVGIIGISFFSPNLLPPAFAENKEANLLPGCFALGALFATHKNLINISGQGLLALALLSFLLWTSPFKIFIFYLFAFYGCLYLSKTSFFITRLKMSADPSYGVYIYGFVIQQCLAHIFPTHGVLFNQVGSAFVAILIGLLSWVYIEKPSIYYVKRVIGQTDLSIYFKNGFIHQMEKVMGFISGKKLIMFAALLAIAWLVHFIALSFIFPGYYRPLSFQHSDFYIPAAFAYAPNDYYSFTSLLHWPRPIFMWFYKFTGYFGHAGSIAWVVAIVFINCALTALLFVRLLDLKVDFKFYSFFSLYCFLLFTQPYFYTFYSQDIGSQLSYLLLLSGFFAFYLLHSKTLAGAAAVLFCCSVFAFLVKETYILSFGLIAFCWLVYYLKKDLLRALAPGLAVGVAAIIAAVVNFRTKSVFVNPNAAQGSDYQMDLNIISIAKELLKYCNEGFGFLVILALASIPFVLRREDKNKLMLSVFFICIGFVILAWLPNALLPFHHFPGYSFNGLYVCFATVFILLFILQKHQKTKPVLWVIFTVLLVSPLSNISKYKGDRNKWVLSMEGIQTNMLAGFRQATKQLLPLDKPVTVLVTGISSPFHPFAFPESIRSFVGGDKAIYYFVVPPEFPANLGRKVDLVNFISEADKGSVAADQEWQFDQTGKLVAVLKIK